jgi:hypothetical protein
VNRKVILAVVIGSLILAAAAIGVLRTLHEETLPDQALIDSILSWETIVEKVPKLAGYEAEEDLILRGETGKVIPITIPSDDPYVWESIRDVGEYDPFRSFTVSIVLYESEAALQEQIRVIPLAGYEVREDTVTTGFLDRTYPELIPGRAGTVLKAFAAKGRLWVSFVVTTDLDADPFAVKSELEELIQVVEDRIVDIATKF